MHQPQFISEQAIDQSQLEQQSQEQQVAQSQPIQHWTIFGPSQVIGLSGGQQQQHQQQHLLQQPQQPQQIIHCPGPQDQCIQFEALNDDYYNQHHGQAGQCCYLEHHHHVHQQYQHVIPLTTSAELPSSSSFVKLIASDEGEEDEEEDEGEEDDGDGDDDDDDDNCDAKYKQSEIKQLKPVDERSEAVVQDGPRKRNKKFGASRIQHNRIERRRRFRIKKCCDSLRTLVPGLSARTDKARVLEQTVEFVRQLVAHIHEPSSATTKPDVADHLTTAKESQ